MLNWSPEDVRLRRRIFWVAFLVRVAFIVLAHTYRIRPAEDHFQFGWEMGRTARALATGFGYADPFEGHTGPTAWSPPLYTLLVASAFKVFGVYSRSAAAFILIFNSLCSAATAAAIFEVGLRCFNRSVARWSGWLWALHPAAMQYAVRWIWEMSATTCIFSFIFVLTLRMRGDDRGQTWPRWIAYGALWATLALTSPTPVIMLPIFSIWLIVAAPNRKRVLAQVLCSGLIFCAMLSPWAWRNWQTFHRFIPLRGDFGAENYLGNSSSSIGFPWGKTLPVGNRAEMRRYADMGEPAWVEERGRKAKAWIATHHRRYAELTAKRVYMFWAGVPQGTENRIGSFLNESFRLINFQLISLAGLLGIALAVSRRVFASWLMAACLLLVPATYYLVTVQARFRHVLEPILCIGSVYLFQQAEPGSFGRAAAARFVWLGRILKPLYPFLLRGTS